MNDTTPLVQMLTRRRKREQDAQKGNPPAGVPELPVPAPKRRRTSDKKEKKKKKEPSGVVADKRPGLPSPPAGASSAPGEGKDARAADSPAGEIKVIADSKDKGAAQEQAGATSVGASGDTLDVRGVSTLTDVSLTALLQERGGALRRLRAELCCRLTGAALHSLARLCPNVTHLEFDGYMLRQSALPDCLLGLRKLEHLELARSNPLDPVRVLDERVWQAMPDLQHVALAPDVDMDGDRTLRSWLAAARRPIRGVVNFVDIASETWRRHDWSKLERVKLGFSYRSDANAPAGAPELPQHDWSSELALLQRAAPGMTHFEVRGGELRDARTLLAALERRASSSSMEPFTTWPRLELFDLTKVALPLFALDCGRILAHLKLLRAQARRPCIVSWFLGPSADWHHS